MAGTGRKRTLTIQFMLIDSALGEVAVRLGLIAGLPLIFVSVCAFGRPQSLGPLWQGDGVSLIRAACKSDDPNDRSCRAIDLREGQHTQRLGTGYIAVRLVWSGHSSGATPDALVIGESGGSGGYAELFAVTLDHGAKVQKLVGERLEGVQAKPSTARLRLNLPFDIEHFNGAPHAGTSSVPIPTVWKDGDFLADVAALVQPPVPQREYSFRELAIRQELQAWKDAKFPSRRLFPPESDNGTLITVQGLIDLMLTGHADQARALLHRAWPGSLERSDVKLGGEKDFWRGLCRAILHHPLWTRLRLDRLPRAEVIRAGAA